MNRRGRRGFIDRLTAPDALIVQPDLKEHARLVAARVEGNPLGRVEALNAQPRLEGRQPAAGQRIGDPRLAPSLIAGRHHGQQAQSVRIALADIQRRGRIKALARNKVDHRLIVEHIVHIAGQRLKLGQIDRPDVLRRAVGQTRKRQHDVGQQLRARHGAAVGRFLRRPLIASPERAHQIGNLADGEALVLLQLLAQPPAQHFLAVGQQARRIGHAIGQLGKDGLHKGVRHIAPAAHGVHRRDHAVVGGVRGLNGVPDQVRQRARRLHAQLIAARPQRFDGQMNQIAKHNRISLAQAQRIEYGLRGARPLLGRNLIQLTPERIPAALVLRVLAKDIRVRIC